MRILVFSLMMIVTLGWAPANVSASVDDDLIAYWPFDGDPYDVTGHGYDGIEYGTTRYEDGVFNNAIRFDNQPHSSYFYVSDYVSLPPVSLDTFSLSFWVRHNYNAQERGHGYVLYSLNEYVSGSDYFAVIGGDPGYLGADLKLGEDHYSIRCGAPLEDHEWHHVVVIIDEYSFAAYVDGELSDQIATPRAPNFNSVNQFFGYHEWWNCCAASRFNGWIDEARLYQRAVTADDVEILFHGCTFGPETALEFSRQPGKPVIDTASWDSCGGQGVLLITIDRVSSATIVLNGDVIATESDFNQPTAVLSIPAHLIEGENTIEVELRSKPGSSLIVEVVEGE